MGHADLYAQRWNGEPVVYDRTISPAAEARPPSLEQYVSEKYTLPSDWKVFRWQAHGEKETGFSTLTGAVVTETYKTGKRKGLPKWSARDKSTELQISIPQTDFKLWIQQWESETGLCHQCLGCGLEWVGWSKRDGCRYGKCRNCGGSGTRPA